MTSSFNDPKHPKSRSVRGKRDNIQNIHEIQPIVKSWKLKEDLMIIQQHQDVAQVDVQHAKESKPRGELTDCLKIES